MREGGAVEALYATPRVMVAGGLGAVLAGLACAWLSGDRVFVGFAAAMAIVLAMRVVAGRSRCARGALSARRLAVTHGTLATALLGAMAFYAVRQHPGTATEMCGVALVFANAVGVTGRSFGSRLLVRLQMATLCLPLMLAFAMAGTPGSLMLALLPLMLFLASIEIADAQRATLDRALAAGRRSEELADRLSITLETTPGGLLMFDAEGRLRFANAHACRVLGIEADDMPRSGGAGLDRREVEARIDAQLEPAPDSGLIDDRDEPDMRRRVLAARGDAARVHRFVERSNAAGETVLRIDDVSALHEAERRAVRMARYDVLTDLAARGWFFERGAQMLVEAEARGRVTALVAVLDLDGLKPINDHHGHGAGDEAIRALAVRLARVVGTDGLAARLGGDEFALLALFEGAGEAAAARAGAMQAALEGAIDFTVETARGSFAARASCGVARQEVGRHTLDELIERADFAQYSIKRDPDRRLALFDDALEVGLERRKRLAADLPEAIRGGEITVLYRPLVDGRARPTGFEAVPRWHHDTLGTVEAAELLPAARALDLDEALLGHVMQAATGFCAALPAPLDVTVVADSRDIVAGALPDQVAAALSAATLEPARLTVQIEQTRPVMLDPVAIATLEAIKAHGARLALAGFGTGASGIVSLQRLPLDLVVFDGRAIAHGGDPTIRAKAGEVLALSRAFAGRLGLALAIDGVASEEDQAWLTGELGYEALRGPLFGPPLPARDALELARRTRRTGDAAPAPITHLSDDATAARLLKG